jgi:hypothetical protein
MGRITTVRAGIETALHAIPGCASYPVEHAMKGEDVEAVAVRFPCFVVVWVPEIKREGPPSLGTSAPEDQRIHWLVVIVDGSYRASTEALSQPNGLEEIYERVMDQSTGLRGRIVATFNDEAVRMEHEGTGIEFPKDHSPHGGKAFLVTRWQTEEFLG